MTRREFVGWMLASVVAMVAGSRIWRLFRRLFEEQREQLVGVVTEVNQALKTITVSYSDQHGRHWTAAVEHAQKGVAPYAFDVAPTDRGYLSSLFRVGDSVAIPMVRG